jgi:hypothetical protein
MSTSVVFLEQSEHAIPVRSQLFLSLPQTLYCSLQRSESLLEALANLGGFVDLTRMLFLLPQQQFPGNGFML